MIISIDGICASGKSSVIQHIAEQKSVKVIAEFMDHDISSEMMNVNLDDSNASSSAKNNLKVLGRIEQLRLKKLRMFDINKDIIFVDRSYKSCLAFDYAIDRMGVEGVFEYSRVFWNTLNTIPIHKSFVFNISHHTMQKRIIDTVNNYNPLLLHPVFNQHFMDFFKIFSFDSKNIEINENISIVDISNKIMGFLEL